MPDTPARCEPPEALRNQDGWHWVQHPGWTHPSRPPRPFLMCVKWWDARHDGAWDDPYGTGMLGAEDAARRGYRYDSPAPSPAEIAALVRAGRRAEAVLRRMDTLRHLTPEFPALDALAAALAAPSFKEIPTDGE